MENNIINNELNKINEIYNYYSTILNNTDLNKINVADHIINIRHYIELLNESIDEFNNYLNLKNIPICNEQIQRDKEFNENKKNLSNAYILYTLLNNDINN